MLHNRLALPCPCKRPTWPCKHPKWPCTHPEWPCKHPKCPCKRPKCIPFCLWLCCSGSTRSPYRRTVFWKMPGKGSGTGIACGTTHRACTQRSPACLAMSASNNTGRQTICLCRQAISTNCRKVSYVCSLADKQPAPLLLNACTAVQTECDYQGSAICTACLCRH